MGPAGDAENDKCMFDAWKVGFVSSLSLNVNEVSRMPACRGAAAHGTHGNVLVTVSMSTAAGEHVSEHSPGRHRKSRRRA